MTRTVTDSAFYTVADSRFFIGLAGLVNSLRLVGHDQPIYVTDCGLNALHRRRLAEHVTLVEPEDQMAPHYAKTVAPLAHPSGVAVLLDADVIVTRPLTPLIDVARPGKIVAFADDIANRFDERWSELLGLGPLRQQPYVNSGVVAGDSDLLIPLLGQVASGCEQIDFERTCFAHGTSEYPFYYLDQDVLNALLGTYPAEHVEVLEHRLAPFPPFAGVRVADETLLRCSYRDGQEPFVLHHIARKPWIAATRWNIYSHLLARVLLGDDVAVPVRRDELPLRLRPGAIAWVEKRRSDVLATLFRTRARLGLRRRLRQTWRGWGTSTGRR